MIASLYSNRTIQSSDIEELRNFLESSLTARNIQIRYFHFAAYLLFINGVSKTSIITMSRIIRRYTYMGTILKKLGEAELEIMQVIWDSENPVTSNHILKKLQGRRQWQLSTLMTSLTRLRDKGFISCDR